MVFIDVSSCTHIASADVQRHGVALLQMKTTGNDFFWGGGGLISRWKRRRLGATITIAEASQNLCKLYEHFGNSRGHFRDYFAGMVQSV